MYFEAQVVFTEEIMITPRCVFRIKSVRLSPMKLKEVDFFFPKTIMSG